MKSFLIASLLATFISLPSYAAAVVAPTSAGGVDGSRDRLIDQMLAVSGMKQSLQELPAEAAMGFVQAALRSGATEDEKRELAKTLTQAFPRDAFFNSVVASLKKNYDERRYRHFLQLVSTPLALKMTRLEAQQPAPAEVQAFLTRISRKHLSPGRIRLIKRMDEATRSGEMFSAMMMASLEAGALAAGGDCSIAIARIRRTIEKSRPIIEKSGHNRAEMTLAFTYRNVPDAELGNYLKLYEDKDSIWVDGIVEAAIAEQFKSSMKTGLQGIRPIILAHRPKKTMFAPKCGQSESPGEDDEVQEAPVRTKSISQKVASANLPAQNSAASAARKRLPGKPVIKKPASKQSSAKSAVAHQKVATFGQAGGKVHHYPGPERDLRYCLRHSTDAEIIACAEK